MRTELDTPRKRLPCTNNCRRFQKIQGFSHNQDEQGQINSDTAVRKTLRGQAEFVSIKDKIAKKVFGALPDVPGIKRDGSRV